jgi:hypothetical protein
LKATFDALQLFRPKAIARATALRAPQAAPAPVAVPEAPKGPTRKRDAAPKMERESQQTV